MIDLVNCGGNLGSMRRCLERLKAPYRIAESAGDLNGNPIVLPGVGQFGTVMERLNKTGLSERIKDLVLSGTPYLGICVGMQIIFDESEESPGVKGLGFIEGDVVRFKKGKIPHIGWNRVEPAAGSNLNPGFAYFVHSYYARPRAKEKIIYRADYFGPFCAAVADKNITAFQFHPEKSHEFGHELLRRWIDAL